jgi:hypothetical protein
MERFKCICLRCGHVWFSRENWPKYCASCKKKYWWREKRVPKPETELGSVGRPSPHVEAIKNLNVGEKTVIAWYPPIQLVKPCYSEILKCYINNEQVNIKNVKIGRAVRYYAKRTGRVYHTEGTHAGLLVTRIS